MVKVKENSHILADGSIDIEAWLNHLDEQHHYANPGLIRNACVLSRLAGKDQATESGESCLQQGLAMADILVDLELDQQAVAAAIIYDSVRYAELSIEDVQEQLGAEVAQLVSGVERMNAIDNIHNLNPASISHQQLDNFRKMLIAMVDDVRVVLIKLAERLCVLRTIAHLGKNIRKHIAKEILDIYAPLANRLGIAQIKWEMEDLSFRYLEPETYKAIAQDLNARRVDRDRFVKQIVETLQAELSNANIHNSKIYGRAKHIHSIHRKMQRKNIDLSQIYDATAVRVLVPTIKDCYQVLSIVHSLWQPIPIEFDDYIADPKPNGYRSLHTAVMGENDKHFEVQIRTYEMHEEAELGVAAHWQYKEGERKPQQASHERKIEWLRQVLAWEKELAAAEGISEDIENKFLEERIYVLTPQGDITDLPQGATPLDFAYHIHSSIGHRCRGAKVNGHMVQLTYPLKTGEQVEILTTREAKPSRDWLNPNLGYLKSSRAKAKVHHWFRQQDYNKNCEEGAAIVEKEFRKLHIKPINFDTLAGQFNFKKGNDLFAAVGRNEISVTQIINKIAPATSGKEETLIKRSRPTRQKISNILVEGGGNFLTHIAKCCQPVPGDAIIGYITLGRGISIHRQDCTNIVNASEKQQIRFISVSWTDETITSHYPINIYLQAHNRHGLLRDITTMLSSEKTHLLSLNTHLEKIENLATVHLTVEINNLTSLNDLLDKLKAIKDVTSASRTAP